MTPIANRLKAEIENKGISYSSISRKTNIPINTISRSLGELCELNKE